MLKGRSQVPLRGLCLRQGYAILASKGNSTKPEGQAPLCMRSLSDILKRLLARLLRPKSRQRFLHPSPLPFVSVSYPPSRRKHLWWTPLTPWRSHILCSFPFPSTQGSYVGIHSTGFRDFLLKPELLRAISDLGFEHPSEGEWLMRMKG